MILERKDSSESSKVGSNGTFPIVGAALENKVGVRLISEPSGEETVLPAVEPKELLQVFVVRGTGKVGAGRRSGVGGKRGGGVDGLK